ncbi:MAG: autotransporter outer membrane beta-barrel domain-containing protein [Methyloligellaceae bacterium]
MAQSAGTNGYNTEWTIESGRIEADQQLGVNGLGIVEVGGTIRTNNQPAITINAPAASAHLFNHGEIIGQSASIHSAIEILDGDFITIENTGSIYSDDHVLTSHSQGIIKIDNTGQIQGEDKGIFHTTGSLTGENHNLISTDSISIEATDIINFRNTGSISSDWSAAIHATNIVNFHNAGKIAGTIAAVSAREHVEFYNSGIVSASTIVAGRRALRMGWGVLDNDGLIEAPTGVEVITSNYDLVFTSLQTTIRNGGIIRSLDGPEGFAINFRNPEGRDNLILDEGNLIIGRIMFWEGLEENDALTVGKGLNLNYSFDKTPEVLQIAGGIYDQHSDADNSATIATVDKTAFTQIDETLAELISGISRVISQRSSGSRSSTRQRATLQPEDLAERAQEISRKKKPNDLDIPDGDMGEISFVLQEESALREKSSTALWTHGFATRRGTDASASTRPADLKVSGLVAGIDTVVNANFTLGAFLGSGKAKLKVTGRDGYSINSLQTDEVITVPETHEYVDTDTIVAGAFGRFAQGKTAIDLSLTLGWTDTTHERVILDNTLASGYENITGTYDGWFIAPEIGVTRTLNELGLEVSLRGRYAAQFLDAYSENGENGIAVSKRDIHMLQARAELARPISISHNIVEEFSVTPYAGAEVRHLLDGDAIKLDLLGNGMSSYTLGQEETELTGFAGLRLSARVSDAFFLKANIEGRLSDTETETLTGAVGGIWKF